MSKPEALIINADALSRDLRDLSIALADKRDAERREKAIKASLGRSAEAAGLDVDQPVIFESRDATFRLSKSIRTTTDYRAVVEELVSKDPSLLRLVTQLLERHTNPGTPTITFREGA